MRKILLAVVIFAFLTTVFLKMNEEKEIRVRVIPHADTAKDLAVKEEAKNLTICYLRQAYSSDYDQYIKNMRSTLDEFALVLENELDEEVTVELSNHTLYNKTYNNSAIENTSQITFYVVIGSGKGSNWWGTVYPEFLEVSSSEELKYESLIANIFKKIKGEKNDKR